MRCTEQTHTSKKAYRNRGGSINKMLIVFERQSERQAPIIVARKRWHSKRVIQLQSIEYRAVLHVSPRHLSHSKQLPPHYYYQ